MKQAIIVVENFILITLKGFLQCITRAVVIMIIITIIVVVRGTKTSETKVMMNMVHVNSAVFCSIQYCIISKRNNNDYYQGGLHEYKYTVVNILQQEEIHSSCFVFTYLYLDYKCNCWTIIDYEDII